MQEGGSATQRLKSPQNTSHTTRSGADLTSPPTITMPTNSSKSLQKKRERSNEFATTSISHTHNDLIKQQRLISSSSPASTTNSSDHDEVIPQNKSVLPDVAAGVGNNSSLVGKDGGLCSLSSVDRLLNIMHHEKVQKTIVDLTANRTMLAKVVLSTTHHDFLSKFVKQGGLTFLDQWLHEALHAYVSPQHPSTFGSDPSHSSSFSKAEAEKLHYHEDLFLTIIGALEKLPVDLISLKTCSIGKTVKSLRCHRNSEIQRRAKKLVDMWKKRVDAEVQQSNGVDHVIHGGDDAGVIKKHKSYSLITDLAEDSVITCGGKFASVATLCSSPERRFLKISPSTYSSPLSSHHSQSRSFSTTHNNNTINNKPDSYTHGLSNDGINMLAKIAASETSSMNSDVNLDQSASPTDRPIVTIKKESGHDSPKINSLQFQEKENASEYNLQPSVQAAVSGITVERSEHLDRISSSVSSPSETNSKLDILMCESRDQSVDTTNSEIISLETSGGCVKKHNEDDVLQRSTYEEKKRVEAVGDSGVTDMVAESKDSVRTKNCVNGVQGVNGEGMVEGQGKDSCDQGYSRISAPTSIGSFVKHNPSVESLREHTDGYGGDDRIKVLPSVISSSSLTLKHRSEMVDEHAPSFDLNELVVNCEDESGGKTQTTLNEPDLLPSSCGPITIPIAIMADKKGSFTLPVLSCQPIAIPGWKGSAATSAFRPTQPRRGSEKAHINTSGEMNHPSPSTANTTKHVFKFDLNISLDSPHPAKELECYTSPNAISMVHNSTCASSSVMEENQVNSSIGHERTKPLWDLNQTDGGGPSLLSSGEHMNEVAAQRTGKKLVSFDLNMMDDTQEQESVCNSMTPRNQNHSNPSASHLNVRTSIPMLASVPASAPPSTVPFISASNMPYPLGSSMHPWPTTGSPQDALFPYNVCMVNPATFQQTTTYPPSHLTSTITSPGYGGMFPLATSTQGGFRIHVPYMETHQMQSNMPIRNAMVSSAEASNCMMIPPHHKNHQYMTMMDMPIREQNADGKSQQQNQFHQHQQHQNQKQNQQQQQYQQQQQQHQHQHQLQYQHQHEQQSGHSDQGSWGKNMNLDLNAGPDQSHEERGFTSMPANAVLTRKHHQIGVVQQQQQQKEEGCWNNNNMQRQERMMMKQVVWKH